MTRGLRILAVDDCPDTGGVLVLVLRLLGHEARLAHDGAEAIGLALAEPPDAVILDLMLPGMSGFEVARALRSQPRLKDVRLIALTGHSQEKHVQQALAAGFDHYLVKPVEPDVLDKLLTGARPTGEPAPQRCCPV